MQTEPNRLERLSVYLWQDDGQFFIFGVGALAIPVVKNAKMPFNGSVKIKGMTRNM